MKNEKPRDCRHRPRAYAYLFSSKRNPCRAPTFLSHTSSSGIRRHAPPPPPPPPPKVGPWVPQSEMLHFNLSANSDSISVLRPLIGVFKVGQIEINHDVAENIKKVLAHRLDKEMRAKLDADVRILSNCERI